MVPFFICLISKVLWPIKQDQVTVLIQILFRWTEYRKSQEFVYGNILSAEVYIGKNASENTNSNEFKNNFCLLLLKSGKTSLEKSLDLFWLGMQRKLRLIQGFPKSNRILNDIFLWAVLSLTSAWLSWHLYWRQHKVFKGIWNRWVNSRCSSALWRCKTKSLTLNNMFCFKYYSPPEICFVCYPTFQ